jgi:hypothetical protein
MFHVSGHRQPDHGTSRNERTNQRSRMTHSVTSVMEQKARDPSGRRPGLQSRSRHRARTRCARHMTDLPNARTCRNSGRCVLAYLCADLDAVGGRSDRQFSLLAQWEHATEYVLWRAAYAWLRSGTPIVQFCGCWTGNLTTVPLVILVIAHVGSEPSVSRAARLGAQRGARAGRRADPPSATSWSAAPPARREARSGSSPLAASSRLPWARVKFRR